MNTAVMIEIFGYIGSGLVVISMLMSSIVRLRIINTIGSTISAVYAVICGAFPLVLMNACLIVINIFSLIKLLKSRQVYDMVPASPDDAFVTYFLQRYADDIRKYFPGYQPGAAAGQAYLVWCGGNPAGVLLGQAEDGILDIMIDYSAPAYRDCSVGACLYAKLPDQKIHTLRFAQELSETHKAYIHKMNFVPEDGAYIRRLVRACLKMFSGTLLCCLDIPAVCLFFCIMQNISVSLQYRMRPAVLLRGHMADALECLGKVAAGRKTGGARNFLNAVAGRGQKVPGSRNPYLCQVRDGGCSIERAELVAQIVFGNIAAAGKRVQRDFMLVIFLDIASGLVAFAAAARACKLAGNMVFAVYHQDKDSQVMLADFFIAFFAVVHFAQNAFKAQADRGCTGAGTDNAVFRRPVCADFQSFHAQDIVV